MTTLTLSKPAAAAPSREAPATGSIAQCVTDIDHFIQKLDQYSDQVIAVALRAHLGVLLQALVAVDSLSPDQVRHFIRALEVDALGPVEASAS